MTNVAETKTIQFKTAATCEWVLTHLRGRGIKCSLAGSHGGDGLRSQGGHITGVSVPAAFADCYIAVAASFPRTAKLSEIVDATISALAEVVS